MRDRIEVLDWLRGFAALSVAWYHFTSGSGLFTGAVKASGSLGWLGVEAFFVISGFVIPYSMRLGGYRGLQDAAPFVIKRLTRLEPPYLLSLLLVVGLLYASAAAPGFRGNPPNVTPLRVLLHLGYLNVFFARDWFNPVYWTLAVELQFYLSMIFLFPLLSSGNRIHRCAAFFLMSILSILIHDRGFLFPYLGLFALGACAYHVRTGQIGRLEAAFTAAALSVFCFFALGPAVAIIGLATASCAAVVNPPRIPLLALLGTISYSLYLLHVPVGGRVMNLAARLAPAWHAPALVVAVFASIAAAYIFWWGVERPSQRLSARVKYGGRQSPYDAAVEAPTISG